MKKRNVIENRRLSADLYNCGRKLGVWTLSVFQKLHDISTLTSEISENIAQREQKQEAPIFFLGVLGMPRL
ncbi:hypothetical protein Y1Q_0012508 [Alligator mississippiensis]|uniref:Uncharacterized protein n=1 Tax=Alligator mississippiensis TaxID=8496 RepID=A0A151M7W5_ALLMI|nr:hypothetical protein Y1Q_0012508 [Alligator mississippiensis]